MKRWPDPKAIYDIESFHVDDELPKELSVTAVAGLMFLRERGERFEKEKE